MRLVVLLFCALTAGAEEPSVSALVETIRFHPEGESARLAVNLLSRRGETGWQALGSVAMNFEDSHLGLAMVATAALADGIEPKRLDQMATTYSRLRNEGLRAHLALGLAWGYPRHEALLLKRLRENGFGAEHLLEILAERELHDDEVYKCLKFPNQAPVAYKALLRRGITPRPEHLVPWASAVARTALNPETCRRLTRRKPDFLFLRGVALALNARDDAVRTGAHCLLLCTAGKNIPADADLWRSWIESFKGRWTIPWPDSPGHIAAAVARGVHWLRQDLLADGRSVYTADRHDKSVIGATSLAVMALRAAKVPVHDPAIQKALKETLLVWQGGRPAIPAFDRGWETYLLSLLAMALESVDGKKFRQPLDSIKRRLVQGQLKRGFWAYVCVGPTDTLKPGTPDNSNTQYALLGLRALRKARLKIEPEVFSRNAAYWRTTINKNNHWGYRPPGMRGSGDRGFAMTSAGLSSLALCLEALHGRDAADRIAADPVIQRALKGLGRLLMIHRYYGGGCELYAYYGVERACVLTHTKAFRSANRRFDWYAEGARHLIRRQNHDGTWGIDQRHIRVGQGYGFAIDTAYAVMFLTRATATIGASKGTGEVKIELEKNYDKPDPPREKPEVAPDPPPPPPEIILDRDRIGTVNGEIEVRGRVKAPGPSLTVDGEKVPLDVSGRFTLVRKLDRAGRIVLVARSRNGTTAERAIEVVFDTRAPTIRMMGGPRRHVGKQIIEFRSDEPLSLIRFAGRVFPAASEVVRAAVDLRPGDRMLNATATDLAGLQTLRAFKVVARNRILTLDGGSAVGVDLRARPPLWTLECWARADQPKKEDRTLFANTESAGFTMAWSNRRYPFPHVGARMGRHYVHVGAAKPWRWTTWAHLAATYDGKLVRYFVNGKLQDARPGEHHVTSRMRLFIGAEPSARNWPQAFYVGAIDEVRISDVTRYEKNFKPERSFMRDGHTILLLHFDLDSEGKFLDDSGRHCHGYAHGNPVIVVERR